MGSGTSHPERVNQGLAPGKGTFAIHTRITFTSPASDPSLATPITSPLHHTMNFLFGGLKHKKDADEATIDRPATASPRSTLSSAGSSYSSSRGEGSEVTPVSSGSGIATSGEENLISSSDNTKRTGAGRRLYSSPWTASPRLFSCRRQRPGSPDQPSRASVSKRKSANREKKKKKPDSLHVVIYSSSTVEHKQAQERVSNPPDSRPRHRAVHRVLGATGRRRHRPEERRALTCPRTRS